MCSSCCCPALLPLHCCRVQPASLALVLVLLSFTQMYRPTLPGVAGISLTLSCVRAASVMMLAPLNPIVLGQAA